MRHNYKYILATCFSGNYLKGWPSFPHPRQFLRYHESCAPHSQVHFFSCISSQASPPSSFKKVKLSIVPAWCGTPSLSNSLCLSQGNSVQSTQWLRFLLAAQIRKSQSERCSPLLQPGQDVQCSSSFGSRFLPFSVRCPLSLPPRCQLHAPQ